VECIRAQPHSMQACGERPKWLRGALHTFGFLEWESELYRGVMRAGCCPFNLPGRWFHNMNVQVYWATVYHTYLKLIPGLCHACRTLC
jgi:hypothetical protein